MLFGIISLFNIGKVNGLVSDGTKPLTEPMLIYHQNFLKDTSTPKIPKMCSETTYIYKAIQISQGSIS